MEIKTVFIPTTQQKTKEMVVKPVSTHDNSNRIPRTSVSENDCQASAIKGKFLDAMRCLCYTDEQICEVLEKFMLIESVIPDETAVSHYNELAMKIR